MLEAATIIYLSTILTQVVVTKKTPKHFSLQIRVTKIEGKIMVQTMLQYRGLYCSQMKKCFYIDA